MAQTTFVQEGRQIEFTPQWRSLLVRLLSTEILLASHLAQLQPTSQEPWLWMVYSTFPNNQVRALQLRLGLPFTGMQRTKERLLRQPATN